MAELIIEDMQNGYREVLAHVLGEGIPVSPRGMTTREITGYELIVRHPHRALPVYTGRDVNVRIAAVEALQLLGCVVHPELMVKATPNFKRFMNGGTFHGGYGERVRGQLEAVEARLHEDPHTRQAVVVIWDPMRDLFVSEMNDYPCTIALQFLIRNHRLELHTHMRSNDVWLGLAYDVFVFTQLQLAMAAALAVNVGAYHHHAVSFHIYERDVEAAQVVIGQDAGKPWTLRSLVQPGVPITVASQCARSLLTGCFHRDGRVVEKTYDWYEEVLSGVRAG